MKIVYSPMHLAHAPKQEFERGQLHRAVEIPARVENVRRELEKRKLGPIHPADEFGLGPILRIHDGAFVEFMSQVHTRWAERYGDDAPDALPSVWPAHGLRSRRKGDVESALGSYGFDTASPIGKGTWDAALSAVNVALTAARSLRDGEQSAFALARPPGHHASSDLFGGYCYLNNVAIAAQWLCDCGLKPAILDVDYHHGNGTQTIFYRRRDVFFASIHADPAFAYPHFLGFADESGEGDGEDANLNLPLPDATAWPAYRDALDTALQNIRRRGADVLLVSLGLDTFEMDPISRFRLSANDYFKMGECIAQMGLPTLFVFEGGYNIVNLGLITANVLEGFLNGY